MAERVRCAGQERCVVGDPVKVLVVALDEPLRRELEADDGCVVSAVGTLEEAFPVAAASDAIVIDLLGLAPLEVVEGLRSLAPDAALVVVTTPDDAADGAIAMHAGAEDHLVRGSIPAGLLPRAVRYAAGMRRLRTDLATQDEATGLPNLRGFQPIAEHHLRMADRAGTPVVFVFVRIEEPASGATPDAIAPVREAASIVLEAVRDSDVPARVAPDTFCILLTGDATGAETLVLSRLVEAIAVHNARRDRPRPLALSVGSALYEPGSTDGPASLPQILEQADRRLAEPKLDERPDA
jgi:diguanylate cyclase (GGDEF)-like protein